eukprot:TRINITY_DN8643_c1_g1_i1.p1 TRINITY_DN8643_c1_g1~~TRINITY_DN8643_c1_g1_i1.p1  ORF type:complete len:867 (-),score=167.40 TRINITY_DN8643_c1_g1_i1:1431-3725(-)
MVVNDSFEKDIASRTVLQGRAPLVDVSNKIKASCANQKYLTSEKRRLGRRSSISPFKRPRSSRFSNPLNASISIPSKGSSTESTSEDSCCKKKVSTRYPFQVTRKTINEFFGGPPNHCDLLGHLEDEIRHMSAKSAEKYKFHPVPDSAGIGAEAFLDLLVQSGASLLHATEKWVSNHYKWIVWKLACLERGFQTEASGKYLTVSNVLEELKYRYDREVNLGHRSAIKRIVEGDASPASAMVLCISAIHAYPDLKLEEMGSPLAPSKDFCKTLSVSNGAEKTLVTNIELTDGWYSLDAVLDAPLSKQLVSRKLFVGQKLWILGAGLCGWAGPVSPLECSGMISLHLHMNGTYRAHWADRLGFCRRIGAPLSFSCIKCDGGPVPRTLAGVTRIYPILYKERLADGTTVVRSERMETKTFQLYNQRRSIIAEGVISELQKDSFGFHSRSDSDSEGAQIFKLLETAAEPEILMADMNSEQLASFANFRAKQEEINQSDMLKKIEKALDDAGLSGRQVTPLMRVRVVGLTSKCSQRKNRPREGVVTIWNPTEKQVVDLVEGRVYCIGGLMPLNLHSNIIYLQTRGSATTWQSLPLSATESFEPFFTPRKAGFLSSLGEVPLTSEFDMAAVIVYVGEVFVTGQRKKQWIFLTDGSISGSELQMEGLSNCLLAVCFCSSITENVFISPFSHNLAGSIVGFCNLVKRARDQVNHLWVAEATENSTYFLSTDFHSCTHLKEAANSACKWAAISSATIQKLRERVLCIIGVNSG